MATMVTGSGTAGADATTDLWGFTPITTGALPCSAAGEPAWAAPLTANKLMSAGDAATQVVGGAATTIGRENDINALSADGQFLYSSSENGVPSDGISRYTLTGTNAGKKEILSAGPVAPATTWSRMDGLYTYPVNGQLLGSEEYSPATATANTQARGGGIWQVDPTTGAFARLDWMGSMAHEGLVYIGGAFFFGDENRNGGIFKAVPTNPNDLTLGGTLSFLAGSGIDASGWKLVTNPDNAVAEAVNGGAILFDRPEDFDGANGRVYFTVTEPQADSDTRKGNYNGTAAGGVDALQNQVVNRGGIYSLNAAGFPDLATQSGTLPPYTKIVPMIEVQDPKYTTQAQAQAQQGLQFPDNIAIDGRGHLWVHEDIPDSAPTAAFPANGTDVSKQLRNQQDELWVFQIDSTGTAIIPAATPSLGVKAADMQSSLSGTLTDCTNEFTGGIFGADGVSLFITQQHNQNPTFALSLLPVTQPVVPEFKYPFAMMLSGLVTLGGGMVIMRRRRDVLA
jgi:hypothetical protein